MVKLLIGEGNRDALGKILELLDEFSKDFSITTAEDGMACLKKVEEDLPDLVILSCRLPGLDGVEACRRLKNSLLGKDVPVLLLLPDREDLESKKKGLAAGADDYIIFPFDSIDLVTRIKTMLKIKKLTDEAKQGGGESDRLSAFLAHKLRSPLNSIIGMAELMQKPFYGELNEKQKKFVEIISSSGYRLVEFINEHAPD